MRKRVHLVLAVFLAAAIGLAAWEGLRTREPVYQGKRLSEWLQKVDSPVAGRAAPESQPAAMNAVRAMGADALPALIRMEAARALVNVGREQERAVAAFAGCLSDPNARTKQMAAYYLLQLGPAAFSAVPGLLKALTDPSVAGAAANALKQIAPAAAKALANTNASRR